jgi:hypothetical protein
VAARRPLFGTGPEAFKFAARQVRLQFTDFDWNNLPKRLSKALTKVASAENSLSPSGNA